MKGNEIRIRMNGGYLVAGRTGENDNDFLDGIYIVFETDDGDIVDVVCTECGDRDNINVYCYENVYTEDCTNDYVLNVDEIYKALNGGN